MSIAQVLVHSSFEQVRSMKCYDGVRTERTWIRLLVLSQEERGKKEGKMVINELAIMAVFLTAALYLSNIKKLSFNILLIMVS